MLAFTLMLIDAASTVLFGTCITFAYISSCLYVEILLEKTESVAHAECHTEMEDLQIAEIYPASSDEEIAGTSSDAQNDLSFFNYSSIYEEIPTVRYVRRACTVDYV